MQPPQSYSVSGQHSSGKLTGKPAGARPDYRGRWCAQPIVYRPLGAPVHGWQWNSLDLNQRPPGYRAHPALYAKCLYRMRHSGAPQNTYFNKGEQFREQGQAQGACSVPGEQFREQGQARGGCSVPGEQFREQGQARGACSVPGEQFREQGQSQGACSVPGEQF
ncbi:UNVERIFIED_CONTAM: hypothetical protein FKN15_043645 [Acipenser sinensis]